MSPLSSPKMKAHRRAGRPPGSPGSCAALLRRLFVLWLFMCLLWLWFSTHSRFSLVHDPALDDFSGPIKFGTYTIPDNSSLLFAPPRTLLADELFPANNLVTSVSTGSLEVRVDSYSLTAVLPITDASFPLLESTLLVLLEYSGSLAEVLLVAPQSMQSSVRNILRSIVASEGSHAHVELSVTPWSPGVGEDTAILDLARQVTTDFVLCLDSTGLNFISTATREILMLIKPVSADLPVGPRGVNAVYTDMTCLVPSATPQPASFLIPPLVIPSTVLSELSNAAGDTLDTWSTLGKRIGHAQSDMTGGLAVGQGDKIDRWCPSGQLATPASYYSEVHTLKSVPIREKVPDKSAPQPLRPPLPSSSSFGTFLLMFSSVKELQRFSLAACRLQRNGHFLHALLYDQSLVSGALSDYEKIHLPSGDCHLQYSLFHWPANIEDEAPIFDRFKDIVSLTDVIIASSGHDKLSIALSHMLGHYEEVIPLLIHIPGEDLPYCDWMGTLTLEEWKNWHVPRIDISVITNDRAHSLSRLLSSLSSARYFGDSLDVRINMEQTADLETMRVVDGFKWDRGRVFFHHRVVRGGLLTAVVESWYPLSNDSYGLLLEDDVELSPFFYAWAKMTVLRYRYGAPENRSPQLFGVSLYQQKHLELRPEGRHHFSARNTFAAAGISSPSTPYLSQIPCSWGAVYFPEHWREFHAYLSFRLSATVWDAEQVVVPGVRSNRWVHSWKKYFIELVHLRAYVMLYPNFADYASLSTNHLEVGSHVKDMPRETYLRKKRLFLLPLMRLPEADELGVSATGLLDLPDAELPPWSALPVVDLLGLLCTEGLLLERGRLRRAELTDCAEAASPNHDVWDLLCLDDSPFAPPHIDVH